jgi:NADH-quinone oxidoreductase subunit L
MRDMGGLKKYMPITYWTSLIGSLALIGFPGLAGFYSKDAIIEATHAAQLSGHFAWTADYAYYAVLLGVFVTALYSFRMFFLVFHGDERMDEHTKEHLHETPWVVTLPLVLLAIPSVVMGAIAIGPMLYGHYFGHAIHVAHGEHAHAWHGVWEFTMHGLMMPPFMLAMAGLIAAILMYLPLSFIPAFFRTLPAFFANALKPVHYVLEQKYGFDQFNEWFFAGGSRGIGSLLWKTGDVTMIDGVAVNGTAKSIGWAASVVRHLQTGYLYHYAFAMILGLAVLLGVFVL